MTATFVHNSLFVRTACLGGIECVITSLLSRRAHVVPLVFDRGRLDVHVEQRSRLVCGAQVTGAAKSRRAATIRAVSRINWSLTVSARMVFLAMKDGLCMSGRHGERLNRLQITTVRQKSLGQNAGRYPAASADS